VPIDVRADLVRRTCDVEYSLCSALPGAISWTMLRGLRPGGDRLLKPARRGTPGRWRPAWEGSRNRFDCSWVGGAQLRHRPPIYRLSASGYARLDVDAQAWHLEPDARAGLDIGGGAC